MHNLKPDTRLAPNVDSLYAAMSGRKMFRQDHMEEYDAEGSGQLNRMPPMPVLYDPQNDSHMDKANLVSSETEHGSHLPVIDCDYPIQAVPSSTPGHYHLYIDKKLSWQQYEALLNGLFLAGLIQEAWYRNALEHKRSYVRMPHIQKSQ